MTTPVIVLSADERVVAARRGMVLSRMTLGYNALEGVVAVVAGATAGSVALLGFGVDSIIEVASSMAALFRLRHDADPLRRARAEAIAVRIVGCSFVVLSAYIVVDAGGGLLTHEVPERSLPGADHREGGHRRAARTGVRRRLLLRHLTRHGWLGCRSEA